jgi:cell fate (sporulation/competence/biofilm development) regulator YlbF (YheA/YmcA/DUF963 family)
MQRELQKIKDAVTWVTTALVAQAEHDAAMHMNATVRHNPATVALMTAEADLRRLITELEDEIKAPYEGQLS